MILGGLTVSARPVPLQADWRAGRMQVDYWREQAVLGLCRMSRMLPHMEYKLGQINYVGQQQFSPRNVDDANDANDGHGFTSIVMDYGEGAYSLLAHPYKEIRLMPGYRSWAPRISHDTLGHDDAVNADLRRHAAVVEQKHEIQRPS